MVLCTMSNLFVWHWTFLALSGKHNVLPVSLASCHNLVGDGTLEMHILSPAIPKVLMENVLWELEQHRSAWPVDGGSSVITRGNWEQ